MKRFLFEVSWEVCNQVGGIHTVIRSKAWQTSKYFQDRYFLIGPLLPKNIEFEETKEKEWDKIRPLLEEKGIHSLMGRWKIPGNPKVILIDFRNLHDVNSLLYAFWQDFGVDSYQGGGDYVEPVLFSKTAGEVIECVHDALAGEKDQSIAQFHEWMCGSGLLHLRKACPEIATIFTTHATVLGRSLSGSGLDIYGSYKVQDPDAEARTHGVAAKHSMEKASAREADCFTTVSQITALECESMLHLDADHVLPNGFNLEDLPSLESLKKKSKKTRKDLHGLAEKFLLKQLPKETRFFLTSGRYEYRNKGFDLLLESLKHLDQRLKEDSNSPTIVMWILLADWPHRISEEAYYRVFEGKSKDSSPRIVTHRMHNQENDPIVRYCMDHGLHNSKDNRVHVIFCPSYLSGHDGIINQPYYDVLESCDLGIFPSYYEPWGYTPLECIAYGVPTVTTDLAGFGMWASKNAKKQEAVQVIDRKGRMDKEVVEDLSAFLWDFSKKNGQEIEGLRPVCRDVSSKASWKHFFRHYEKAYEIAEENCRSRTHCIAPKGKDVKRYASYSDKGFHTPRFKSFVKELKLPTPISKLRTLAYNLFWAWHPDAQDLFASIDEELWKKCRFNPVKFLNSVDRRLLNKTTKNARFLKNYQKVIGHFERYMNKKKKWKEGKSELSKERPVVYLSMEFGLHESFPIYSGGLGVLSGDHLKSASDLNLPMVAVGIFYKQGYFTQRFNLQGDQLENYQNLDSSQLPMTCLADENGKDIKISVDLPGRRLYARIWEVNVGRIKLYLFDAEIAENSPQDREITARLYCADRETRILQEILLGIGGVKLIEDVLKIDPAVYHLNEGHSAFLLLERLRRIYLYSNLSLQESKELVKSSSIFTTHTPVPAGNEVFSKSLIEFYFSSYIQEMGMHWNQLWELGQVDHNTHDFSMTILALKLSSLANAVSKLHGVVSRKMWKNVWPKSLDEEVPIGSVTNGVHYSSWVGYEMRQLMTEKMGFKFDESNDDVAVWEQAQKLPNQALWEAKKAQKKKLLYFLKHKILQDYVKRGENFTLTHNTIESLNEEAFIIGFARRFAAYKRGDLILKNQQKLRQILSHKKHPVLFLFSGKSHPENSFGKFLVKQIIEASKYPEYMGKIIFLEDYDIGVAKELVQGVDLWLNFPTRMQEASGTSGMKVIPNCGLNCSILDGWWHEAFHPQVGWAIDPPHGLTTKEYQDQLDVSSFYYILESKILPLFFQRNTKGIPNEWLKMIKSSMLGLGAAFSSMRMLRQYTKDMYFPAFKNYEHVRRDDYALVRLFSQWRSKINSHFCSIKILDVQLEGIQGDLLGAQDSLDMQLFLDKGRLEADDIRVELVLFQVDSDRQYRDMQVYPFKLNTKDKKEKILNYHLKHRVEEAGSYSYGVRVVPYHPHYPRLQDLNLVYWV